MWCEKEVSYRNGIGFLRIRDPDPDPVLFLTVFGVAAVAVFIEDEGLALIKVIARDKDA
jgi:hypothetical protein